ncbi:unnamed protein product [Onchocerca ochengi]|uniref:Chromo domain-containing protein n=1 Tax=Onchocerca ochengi TaxID=42157 RepID=A0A182EC16_ONCOC|nr:unnamed protein product [Onchocerca ochengi]
MTTEDSFISNTPHPNPVCGDVILTEASDALPMDISMSNEDQARNVGQDSDSVLMTDTESSEEQNDEAEHYDIQLNSEMSSVDDIAKTDLGERGRSLKKDRSVTYRNRQRSHSENPRIISLHKKRAIRRRDPTPYPTKLPDPIDFDE